MHARAPAVSLWRPVDDWRKFTRALYPARANRRVLYAYVYGNAHTNRPVDSPRDERSSGITRGENAVNHCSLPLSRYSFADRRSRALIATNRAGPRAPGNEVIDHRSRSRSEARRGETRFHVPVQHGRNGVSRPSTRIAAS